MNRSTIKVIGLLVFLVAGIMAACPIVAEHTQVFSTTGDFKWVVHGVTLMQLYHLPTGKEVVEAWRGLWFLAIGGEVLLIGLYFFAPLQRSRHIVTHRAG